MNIVLRGINKFRRCFPERPIGSIYALHRCAPVNRENLVWNEHLKVSPEYLEEFLVNTRRTHDVISLDDLYEISILKKEPPKPFTVMTFDDGYADNYDYALPVFEKLKMPFAVYVSNSFPEWTAFLWWYILEDILLSNSYVSLADGRFRCETKREKEDLFLLLRAKILKLNQEKLEEEFSALFTNYKFDAASYAEKLCLSYGKIMGMANSGFCTIGTHTLNHKALNRLSAGQMEHEITTGRTCSGKNLARRYFTLRILLARMKR